MAQVVKLTVFWPEEGKTITIQAPKNITPAQACVLALTEFEKDSSIADHYGLLRKSSHGGFNIWLPTTETIGSIGLKNGDQLRFALRRRSLKVRLIDGNNKSVRTVMIDESQPLGVIVKDVCNRIGIQNHEEYSFALEDDDANAVVKQSTKKKKESLAELRKRLADEEKWLQHELTLREQGIEPFQPLVLRKKYFYTDQDINKDDPVQVNLLYGQSKDSIINGENPCTIDEAITFAAMQLHVDNGDFNPDRHKPGFIDDIRVYIPAEYAKVKGVEKKIYPEYKKFQGTNELTIKYRYITMCRSLKTYGITFFTVREKAKGKNKLITRLLGITRESVMRMDEKTKEVLRTWPLTTVKRWVSSPNSFTLDFGGYSDYYSCQTFEGEKISNLIAGYIDIILKKRAQQDKREKEEAKMASLKETEAQRGELKRVSVKELNPQKMATIRGESLHVRPRLRSSAQAQTLMVTLASKAIRKIQLARAALSNIQKSPDVGNSNSARQWKEDAIAVSLQNVNAQTAAIVTSTASIVTNTAARSDRKKSNFTAVSSSIATIASNTQCLAEEMANLMSLQPATQAKNKQAAEELFEAVKVFVETLSAPADDGSLNRGQILSTSATIGQAASNVLILTGASDTHPGIQDQLIALTKGIATSTSTLVGKAKIVAGKCVDGTLQTAVITAAKTSALSTTQLATCAKLLSPAIQHPASQNQLQESARVLAAAIEALVSSSQSACQDATVLAQLGDAALEVTSNLNELLSFLQSIEKQISSSSSTSAQYEDACTAIWKAAEELQLKVGDTRSMVAAAKNLAKATAVVVGELKARANKETDPVKQQEALRMARLLADGTAKLVESTKRVAQNPRSKTARQGLLSATENLKGVMKTTAGSAVTRTAMKQLVVATKQCATSGTQLLALVTSNADNLPNGDKLRTSCAHMRDKTARMIKGLKACKKDPNNAAAQLDLVSRASQFLAPAQRASELSRQASSSIRDATLTLQLSNASRNLNAALANLKGALENTASVSQNADVTTAIESVLALGSAIGQAVEVVSSQSLQPLPGVTAKDSSLEIVSALHVVKVQMNQLVAAVHEAKQAKVQTASGNVVRGLRDLESAVMTYASTAEGSAEQAEILTVARGVMQDAAQFLLVAKQATEQAVAEGSKPTSQSMEDVKTSRKTAGVAIEKMLGQLPGQKKINACVDAVQRHATTFDKQFEVSAKGPEYFTHQSAKLVTNAKSLNAIASELSEASLKGDVDKVAEISKKLTAAHKTFVMLGVGLASSCNTQNDAQDLLAFMKSVSDNTEKVLKLGASVVMNPSGTSQKSMLSAAVRRYAHTINDLISTCTEAGPGQKECDHAVRTIEACKSRLKNPNAPTSRLQYFDTLSNTKENRKILEEALSAIVQHCKDRNTAGFVDSIEKASDAVVAICDNSAHAAYLVSVDDKGASSRNKQQSNIVNESELLNAKETIAQASVVLVTSSSSQQQVMSAAKKIAKTASALCKMCQSAADSENVDEITSQQLVEYSKATSSATAKVIEIAKKITTEGATIELRRDCRIATSNLIKAVEGLLQLAVDDASTVSSTGETSSSSNVDDVRARQAPISNAGTHVADVACSLFSTAKSLIANAKDAEKWELLGEQSKSVNMALDGLITTFVDNAPGQIECDNARYHLSEITKELENTEYACRTQSLEVGDDGTLTEYQEDIVSLSANLRELSDAIVSTSFNDPVLLGNAAEGVRNTTDPLLTAVIGFLSHLKDQESQLSLCEKTKTVFECASQLISDAQKSAADAQNKTKHRHVTKAKDDLSNAITDLTNAIAEHTTLGVADGHISNINRALERLELEDASDYSTSMGLVEFQESANNHARKLREHAQEIVGKALTNPDEMSNYTNDLTNQLLSLVSDTTNALSSSSHSGHLKAAVRELGNVCASLVEAASILQQRPDDPVASKEVSNCAREVVRQTNTVVTQMQLDSQGIQGCIEAGHVVDNVVTDLETTLMFASAGTLFLEEDTTYAAEKQKVRESAKNLIEKTKLLVTSNGKTQEELADAAEQARLEFEKLAEGLRLGAASLGSDQMDAQVLLLNAAKDVGSALTDLLNSTKNAFGKSSNDASIVTLSDHAKTMAANVSNLLKTIGSVENESDRVAFALSAAVQAINRELEGSTLSEDDFKKSSSQCVETLVSSSRPVTSAVTKLVSAISTGQGEKITGAANACRNAVVTLMQSAEVASVMTDSTQGKDEVLDASRNCATAVRSLLDHASKLGGKTPSGDDKKVVLDASRMVAKSLASIGQAAQLLKGDEEDVDDTNALAEQELLTAASAIDNAAKQLAELQLKKEEEKRQRGEVSTTVPEDMPFEEQILVAAKSVANASSALVKAACVAQRDVASSMSQSEAYSDEAQWSSSLTTAAKLVAVATKDLCESANATVQTGGADERLVASAKQVSNSTAQLLVAVRVKLAGDTPSAERVLTAGNAVKKSADKLVAAAQSAIERQAEADVTLDERPVHRMRQEIEAVEAIVRQERELENAKRQLAKIRASKYKRAGTKPMWASTVRTSKHMG